MIEISGISKRYPSGHLALRDVSLTIAEHEVVALIGRSGCGKSTLLRLVAGLDFATDGSVRVAGHEVTKPDRSAGLVFQEPRLMPWLTVRSNVAFGLPAGVESGENVAEAIDRVGLSRFADALPKELSGGMAQRVSIARALVTKPPVLLLDEPFSALDAFTRIDLQQHLRDVWDWYRPTTLLVTHDIDEALVLADRVVVLGGSPGSVQHEMNIDLARPRERSDPGFHQLQDSALAYLSHETIGQMQ